MRAFLLPMLLSAACATAGVNSNSVTLMSNVDYRAPPLTFSVGAPSRNARAPSASGPRP